MSEWPSFKAMTFLRLLEGPADQELMDIAPTMRTLTVKGERYFRMDKTRTMRGEEYGAAYLWERYWDADQIALRKAAAPVAEVVVDLPPTPTQIPQDGNE